MARSLPNTAHAMPPSFPRASASSVTIGSSWMFPEVITSIGGSGAPICSRARAKSCSKRSCTGVAGSITPSSGSLSARPAASATPGRFFSSTIGRAGSESAFSSSGVTPQTLRTASAFAIMTANGLPPRRFPSRSRVIASALRTPDGTRRAPSRPRLARRTAARPPAR